MIFRAYKLFDDLHSMKMVALVMCCPLPQSHSVEFPKNNPLRGPLLLLLLLACRIGY